MQESPKTACICRQHWMGVAPVLLRNLRTERCSTFLSVRGVGVGMNINRNIQKPNIFTPKLTAQTMLLCGEIDVSPALLELAGPVLRVSALPDTTLHGQTVQRHVKNHLAIRRHSGCSKSRRKLDRERFQWDFPRKTSALFQVLLSELSTRKSSEPIGLFFFYRKNAKDKPDCVRVKIFISFLVSSDFFLSSKKKIRSYNSTCVASQEEPGRVSRRVAAASRHSAAATAAAVALKSRSIKSQRTLSR